MLIWQLLILIKAKDQGKLLAFLFYCLLKSICFSIKINVTNKIIIMITNKTLQKKAFQLQ